MGDECRFDFLTAGWKNMKFWQTGPASVLISTKDWHGFNGNLSRRNAMKAEEHKEHRGLTQISRMTLISPRPEIRDLKAR